MGKLAIKVEKDKVRVGLKTKFFFAMMRMMQTKDMGTPTEKKYWTEMGWLGKDRPWKV